MNMVYIPKANLSVGELTVDITPPVEVITDPIEDETTGAFTIPEGQRFIEIYVAGMVIPGDQEVAATIDGETFNVGDTYRFTALAQIDKVFLSPAIAGNGNGGRLFIKYWS